MTKADKARDMIERFPTLSKKKLGELLFRESPKHFRDAEDGRLFVRAVTGSKRGERIAVTHKEFYISHNLKEGVRNDFSPFIVKGKNVGLLFDIHAPYHDKKAIEVALGYFKRVFVDTIILGGDVIDAYQLSRYNKDPEQRISTWEELRIFIGLLNDIRANFPKAEIIYKLGNHDERYEMFLKQNAPQLLDFSVLDLDYLINKYGATKEETELAKKRNVRIVTKKRVLKLGKLNVVHGHEFGKSVFSPVNPARGFYLRAKSNTIGGHHHQTSEHIEKDLDENIIGCWSVGCLCDVHPDYMPINKWNLGFARVTVKDDGNFSVENKKIMDYRIV